MLKAVEFYYLIKLLQSIKIVIVINNNNNNNVIIYWSLSYILLKLPEFHTSNVYKSHILPKAAFICIIYLKNTVETVILCDKMKYEYYLQFKYILKPNLFLWWQSWIFNIIISVLSVTWSLKKSF